MGISDDAVEVRARGWRRLAALHQLIEARLERALQAGHELSVVEFTVLDALSRQDGWHLRMAQLARATGLSPSATTRLVNRLEGRGLITRILCEDDRRGSTPSRPTPAGHCCGPPGPPTTRSSTRRCARRARPPSSATSRAPSSSWSEPAPSDGPSRSRRAQSRVGRAARRCRRRSTPQNTAATTRPKTRMTSSVTDTEA